MKKESSNMTARCMCTIKLPTHSPPLLRLLVPWVSRQLLSPGGSAQLLGDQSSRLWPKEFSAGNTRKLDHVHGACFLCTLASVFGFISAPSSNSSLTTATDEVSAALCNGVSPTSELKNRKKNRLESEGREVLVRT